MKKFTNLLLCTLFSSALYSQNPCSGAPLANTVMPLQHTVCAGTPASMSLANVYTTTGITYQWQSSTISQVGPFSNINGATQSTYTSQPLSGTVYWYNVVITCTNSNQSINVVHQVSVVNCAAPCAGFPATTAIVPVSPTLCAGDVASFSLSSSYTTTGITFQWGNAPTASGPYTAVPNATLSTYTTSPLNATAFYNVVITCTNSGSSYTATQSVAVFNCTYCAGTPGANTVIPMNHTICAGSYAVMGLANSYSASGITFQWQNSNVSPVGPFTSIPGATLSTYVAGPLQTTTFYNVVITCTNSGQSISVPHVVTVVNCSGPCSGTPGVTSVLPLSHTTCAGQAPTMSLSSVYPFTGITYQWASSSSSGGPFTPVAGATLSTYSAAPINATTYYSVSITCTNGGGANSATHTVSVVNCTYCAGTPASNTVQPASHLVCLGAPASMSLAYNYTVSGISYQWQSSATSSLGPFTNISGATQSTYAVSSLTSNGYYNLLVACANSQQTLTIPHMVQVVTCAGLDDQSPQTISIYPNPGKGIYSLMGLDGKECLLNVFDLSGRLLIQELSSKNVLDLTSLSAGTYLVKISCGNRIEQIRLVKEE